MEERDAADQQVRQERDLDRTPTEDWPRHVFPGADRAHCKPVPVVFKQSVLNEIRRHGQSRTDVEICGILVGGGYRDDAGPFVYVEASIRGEFAGSQIAQVTFTAETWSFVHGELDQHHAGKRIIGWYHTHPGFGIFLSPMDLFIHENFFDGPDQLALVYDPLSGEEGVFMWRNGKPTRDAVSIENDAYAEIQGSKANESWPALTAAASAPDEVFVRLRRLESRCRWTLAGLGLVAIIAVLWPLVLPALMPRFGADSINGRERSQIPALERSPASAQRTTSGDKPIEKRPRPGSSPSSNPSSDSGVQTVVGDKPQNDSHIAPRPDQAGPRAGTTTDGK